MENIEIKKQKPTNTDGYSWWVTNKKEKRRIQYSISGTQYGLLSNRFGEGNVDKKVESEIRTVIPKHFDESVDRYDFDADFYFFIS